MPLEELNATAINQSPPPPFSGLQLANGSDFLMLADGTSFLLLAV